MNQLVTTSIVLKRINYGEADRIVTVITPDYGKLRLSVKGARRLKSKLAGGVELFSIAQITFMKGRGDLSILISARLERHWGTIVKDIDRTMLAYDIIKQIDRATEDEAGREYYALLAQTLDGLNRPEIPSQLVRVWFSAQLLNFGGLTPNLTTDVLGYNLSADGQYDFDLNAMSFKPNAQGHYSAHEIKFLRLIFSETPLVTLAKVQDAPTLANELAGLLTTMLKLNR